MRWLDNNNKMHYAKDYEYVKVTYDKRNGIIIETPDDCYINPQFIQHPIKVADSMGNEVYSLDVLSIEDEEYIIYHDMFDLSYYFYSITEEKFYAPYDFIAVDEENKEFYIDGIVITNIFENPEYQKYILKIHEKHNNEETE